ncbi:hypothetical protein [Limnobacter sp. P1]|uniref:hypothetical protein n=1 Tax=Limnobacter olei TaxID=3031298 RepID=UPI0023AEE04D|nr:hypothetical protein [Limnobacter sp. P1]
MEHNELPNDTATPDDVRSAIAALSDVDNYRLRKAATYCLPGTEYQTPQELINEAVIRTMNAASGDRGRRWPRNVPFIAFMMRTIQGIANDSRESAGQRVTDRIEELATEAVSVEQVLAQSEHYHPDIVTQALELEEANEREEQVKAIVGEIDDNFAEDEEVNWILMGIKDDLPASEVRELSGMTQSQYDTARRRFRRGLDKLFPEKRKP